jgi:hypothetical protein
MRTTTSVRALLLACVCLTSGGAPARAETPAPEPPTLTKLCKQHPTDKCPLGHNGHNYVEIYEMLFAPIRNKTEKILEIGVLEGHSLRLWEDYFPNAQISGIDIVDSRKNDVGRVKTFIADQGKREELAKVVAATGGNFDIILDDGGHRMDQQQISFGALFPALKSGGLYVIEDIHTSFPELFPNYGVEGDGQNSTYAMIDRFVRTERFKSQYLTDDEAAYLTANVSYCGYFLRLKKDHSDFFACWKR